MADARGGRQRVGWQPVGLGIGWAEGVRGDRGCRDWRRAEPKSPQGFRLTLDPKKGGGLHALDLKTGKIVWSAKAAPCAEGKTACSPAQSAAVTAIPGVIFSGSVDGHLRAYSASNGGVLWDVDTARDFETVNGKAGTEDRWTSREQL